MAPRDAGFTRWELMLSQSFPMPQMLALRGDAADAATRMAAFRYEAAVRDAIAALEDVHAERRYLAGAEAVQSKLAAVYQRYAEVARAGMDSGAARLPESFRAEALAAQATYDLRLLHEMRGVEDAKLRALLGLRGFAPIGPPADAPAVLALETSNDVLVARAMEWNQDLRGAGVEVEMAAIDRRMARWNRAPMFMVGVGKMFNDDYDMETGKTVDGTTLSFGMTLPIWQHALSAGEREADAKARAAVADEQQMRTMVAADVAMTAFQARTTQRLADLYAKTLVPQAELAMSAADARVRKGEESLASSLELGATWQQMTIARLRAEADHVKAISALERLRGTTLTAVRNGGPAMNTMHRLAHVAAMLAAIPIGACASPSPVPPAKTAYAAAKLAAATALPSLDGRAPVIAIPAVAAPAPRTTLTPTDGIVDLGAAPVAALLAKLGDAATAESALAQTPLDEDLILAAVWTRNPAVAAARADVEATRRVYEQASWLDDVETGMRSPSLPMTDGVLQ
jgi:outer membrane protein TolC